MAANRRLSIVPDEPDEPRRPPARTDEARENELVVLAMDLAEKKLRDGTISAQVHTHFLKLATERDKLERVRIEQDIVLSKAKTDNMTSAAEKDDLYEKAINAFRTYAGADDEV